MTSFTLGFPGGSVINNLPDNAGDMGLIPGLGRSQEVKMAVQCSCLENPLDRGDSQATVHGVGKSQMQVSD